MIFKYKSHTPKRVYHNGDDIPEDTLLRVVYWKFNNGEGDVHRGHMSETCYYTPGPSLNFAISGGTVYRYPMAILPLDTFELEVVQ